MQKNPGKRIRAVVNVNVEIMTFNSIMIKHIISCCMCGDEAFSGRVNK